MNIKTKKFWEKVKSEFNPPEHVYLCSSYTFALNWKYNRDLIRELAWEYLENIDSGGFVGHSKLFVDTNDGSTRSKFLDYMINKFP